MTVKPHPNRPRPTLLGCHARRQAESVDTEPTPLPAPCRRSRADLVRTLRRHLETANVLSTWAFLALALTGHPDTLAALVVPAVITTALWLLSLWEK